MKSLRSCSIVATAVAILALLATGLLPAAAPAAEAAGSIHLSRTLLAPGDAFTVSGSGFTPLGSVITLVDLSVSGTARRVQATVRTDGRGAFTTSLTIPAGTAPRSYTVVATDVYRQRAAANLTVLPLVMVQVGANPPAVNLTAGHGFFIRGAGFRPGEQVIVHGAFPLSNGTSATVTKTATADANGSVGEMYLQVPAGARGGTVPLMATGQVSKRTAGASIAIPLSASVTARPSSALPGQSVTVSGSGFSAGVAVTISATFSLRTGGTQTVSTVAHTNAGGAFAAALTVPNGAIPGPVTLSARGPNTQTSAHLIVAQRTGTVVVRPNPAYPGQILAISGSGFSPGVRITLTATFPLRTGGNRAVSIAVQTSSSGTFTTSLTVPNGALPGKATVVARGPNAQAQSQLIVQQRTGTLSAQPNPALPGQTFTVSGGGFNAGVAVTVSATFSLRTGGTQTVSTTARTNGSGAFNASVTVPNGTIPGAVTLSARGPNRQATARLVVAQRTGTVVVRPNPAFPGQVLGISGSGFSPGIQVTLTATFLLRTGGSRAVSTAVQANASGAFTTSLTVPNGALAGPVTVVTRGPNAQTRTQLIVRQRTAAASAQPNPALPGQTVTVRGGGFSPGVQITISAAVPLYGGGSHLISAAATADAAGQFSAALSIPRNAAAGRLTLTARGPNTQTSLALQIRHVGAAVSVSPAAVIPGSTITVRGANYLAGDQVAISAAVTLTNGARQTLSATATTDVHGAFGASLHVPTNAVGGTYSVVARSVSSGRAPTARFTVARLAPSIVAVPTTAVPGTQMTVNGFGFATGSRVDVLLGTQKLGSALTDAAGKFSLKITVPNLASNVYTLSAVSSTGRRATANLTVNRQVSTHYYFASFYTGNGYHEYIAFLNPSAIRARVTITYELTNGTNRAKTIGINPHSRFTEDVNADVGFHVSAGASIAADVPIAAERVVYHGTDGSVVPGSTGASAVWYFADGNTSHGYREYVAVLNPNAGPVQVALHLFPTHHPAFTVYRTMSAHSRTTFHINSFVRDAVGISITSNGPVIANRTIFIHHGMTSKIGVTAPQRTWYFAAGPRDAAARHWIGAVNPANQWSYLTLRAFDPSGGEVGTVKKWLRPHARVGYLMNRIAHRTDVAVVMMASRPLVAEQTTYVRKMHDAATDTFGVTTPARSWMFAAVNTSPTDGDVLDLFNPNLVPVPIVVQYMNASGATSQQTYVVAPMSHLHIDVGSVQPNAQLGIVAASSSPFVALNRSFFNNRVGSDTSRGIHLP